MGGEDTLLMRHTTDGRRRHTTDGRRIHTTDGRRLIWCTLHLFEDRSTYTVGATPDREEICVSSMLVCF